MHGKLLRGRYSLYKTDKRSTNYLYNIMKNVHCNSDDDLPVIFITIGKLN